MNGHAIAIVGMACRYPDATTPTELWKNTLARRRAFRRLPESRLPAAYLGTRDEPDLAYVTHAAVLRDWDFDRQRFGIPGPLYRAADQTHWLALETAANALDDAGFPDGHGLDRDAVGVVLGNSLTGEFNRAATVRLRWPFIADATATALTEASAPSELVGAVLQRLEQLVKSPFPEPGDEMLTGTLANTIAGRICNQFDFHGTGYTVDGACSSSLLAVMTAARALAAGELDFALAGGVDMSIDPLELVGFSRLGALADGQMRVYDENPTGFLPGEGCGVVALMRAEEAERRGLRSYARIIGWGSSSDGAGGLSRPEQAGQVLALSRAYQAAGVSAGDVGLIEGHGTGTAVGDRVELEALTTVRGQAEPAALSTVKANIGHTKAAAGVAGLIKAALAVFHRVLPPVTGCERPHQLLQGSHGSLRLLAKPEPWRDRVPLAGVSSMGFGGINAHLVIEGAARRPTAALSSVTRRWSARPPGPEIVYLEADEPPVLAERLARLATAARSLSEAELTDIAATAWRDSDAGRVRAALVAETPDRLANAARAAAAAVEKWAGEPCHDQQLGYAVGSGAALRVGLLFPGQAAPVRMALPDWAEPLAVPALPESVAGRDADADTAVAQPAIVRQSLAGLAWLRELGVEPVAATGHSLGEITALHWAGACLAGAALELAGVRGRIMADYGIGGTTMASLAVSETGLGTLLEDTEVVVAGYNAPGHLVVSGCQREIDEVLARARRAGVAASELHVSHGFHSPAMRPASKPLRKELTRLPITATEVPVISTITGGELTATGDELVELLVDQLTQPVLFAQAVRTLAEGCDLLLEVGPGTMLTTLVEANALPVPAVSMDTGGDPYRHAFTTALLAACAGADLEPWFAGRGFRTLHWDATPRFVANPCENRAGWLDATELSIPRQKEGEEPVTAVRVDSDDPLTAVTEYLAKTLELSAGSITPTSSLLGDLHLNSLQVVHLVSSVASAMGRKPPDTALPLTDATVGGVANILAELPRAQQEPASVAGVAPWVRPFEQHWSPFIPGEATPVRWTVYAPEGHWLHELAGTDQDGASGVAVALSAQDGAAEIAALLNRVANTTPDRLLLVHSGHPAAAGIARSVAVELESCEVVVVDVPEERTRLDPAVLTDRRHGRYLELRCGTDGTIERAEMSVRSRGTGAAAALGADDVCVVTGGVLGITAYSAVALAERTGCTLVFAGRSPANDPKVKAELRAIRERVDAHYESCDVADAEAVAGLLASAGRLGPVRGLIHGAGLNEPRRMGDITVESFHATLRPKVTGLRTLLDAAGDELRLVLGFGSIIGRQGLSGQAEYCIANDWLRVDLERWSAAHPNCRTHVLEWSVWSGTGMGVRLDVLDHLRRIGIEPIHPDDGVRALFEVLDDPGAPVAVLLTSRFPVTATLAMREPAGPPPRFAERQLVQVPGVETVLEAKLALGSDLYLDDHRMDGTAVLPAVVGMEAMAQAASLVDGTSRPLSLREVRFRSPVTVDERHGRAIQLAALSGADGVGVVLRDETDRFAGDRFTGKVAAAQAPPQPRDSAEPLTGTSPWYGTLFFHSGRFRRVAGYERLSPFKVEAWLNAVADDPWFSQFLSGQLLLGDPAAHDAALHALLACVPHRQALPIGVDRFTVWQEPAGPLRVIGTETEHTADEYRFDVELLRPDGGMVAHWHGLELRAVGPRAWPAGLPARLIGPWLSRRLIECGIDDRLELVTMPGPGSLIRLDADGPSWAVLPADVDTELDPVDRQVAELLGDKTGEDVALTSARVRCGLAALHGLGRHEGAPMRIDQVTEDGIVVARCGRARILTARIRPLESGVLGVLALADLKAS